ncbi:glycine betaine ABC transporter substrate-binding protein [Actinomycetospora termitidis]|uniref:Glycine betaine ABC transporter substrate-binding protein n=1 Tax=Actinomycetospora termitidis TaxID=3053470 RepID=A0ABT7M283_9PSEU|nr:glycine betaine ABC transporter substrate-binding protein [Actinomycetospora sp. Odt1-22]MDL5154765.1 glycine betaine ABC transporter substrate-binding protein [Actinomycetospora sp. Odt1-22]
MRAPVRSVRSLGAVLLLVVLAAGCGNTPLRSPDASGGGLARYDLRGASLVVGGGATTELRLLCQLTIAAVQAASGAATDECGKDGGTDVHAPTGLSDVDTGWASLRTLGPRGLPDPDGAPADPPPDLDAIRATDAARGIAWLPPTAFGDTDVVVARAPGPIGVTGTDLCVAPEAVPGSAVAPGSAALTAAYGLAPPVVVPDVNAVLVGVATGRCTAGLVPGSSGRVPALGLVVADDVRRALDGGPAGPRGYAPVLRTGLLAGHPPTADVLGEITRRLDGPAMRGMVREVEVDGRDPRDVARRWLTGQGLIAAG